MARDEDDEIERMIAMGLISAKQLNEARYQKSRAPESENPEADYGPDDAFNRGHLDSRPMRRGDKESKLSSERTPLDRPEIATKKRATATLGDQWSWDWYSDTSR